jgi:HEAT repeat protein
MDFSTEVRKLAERKKYDDLLQMYQRGEAVVPELIKLLRDEASDVREVAAEVIGNIAKEDPNSVKKAISGLTKLMGDENEPVRRKASFALGLIEDSIKI